jgi:hypothetical protein
MSNDAAALDGQHLVLVGNLASADSVRDGRIARGQGRQAGWKASQPPVRRVTMRKQVQGPRPAASLVTEQVIESDCVAKVLIVDRCCLNGVVMDGAEHESAVDCARSSSMPGVRRGRSVAQIAPRCWRTASTSSSSTPQPGRFM